MKLKETQITENREKSNEKSDEKSSSLTSKQKESLLSISNQLATPKTISQHMITFSLFQTRYIENGRTKYESMKIQNQNHD